jgi:hypothetical protein
MYLASLLYAVVLRLRLVKLGRQLLGLLNAPLRQLHAQSGDFTGKQPVRALHGLR